MKYFYAYFEFQAIAKDLITNQYAKNLPFMQNSSHLKDNLVTVQYQKSARG